MVNGNSKKQYNDESISSLKGADRVRLRPSVIFGSDGLEGCEHTVFEILSNSIDEAREGLTIMQKRNDITGNWYSVSFTLVVNTIITPVKTMNSALALTDLEPVQLSIPQNIWML